MLMAVGSLMAEKEVDMQKLQKAQKYLSDNTNVYARTTVQELKDMRSIGSWDLTDSGLGHLEALPNLEVLNLADNRKVTDAGMEKLNRLSGLKKLVLVGTNISDRGILKLRGLKNLKTLTLSSSVGAAGLRHLARNFPGLRELKITSPLGADEYETFAGMKRIEYLDLTEGKNVSDEGLKSIGVMESLKTLFLFRSDITDAGLKHLKNPLLEDLRLGNTRIRGSGLASLAQLKNLKALNLNQTAVDDDGLEHIVGLSRLESLVLIKTPISNAGLKHLGNLTGLKELYLSDVRIDEDGIAYLKPLKRLEKLDISFTEVGGSAVWTLTGLPELRSLHIKGSRIGPLGLQWLRFRMPNLRIDG